MTYEHCSTLLILGITTLNLALDLRRQSGLEPQLLRFVGSLGQLTALKLSTCVTDNLLAALGLACPRLRIFDAEADTDMAVTDRGLAFLSSCSLLESVVLNDDG